MAHRIARTLVVGALTAAALAACSPSATQAPANSQAGAVVSPTTGTSPVSRTVSFASDVQPLLKGRCAGCHSTGGRGAEDVEMFDASGAPKFDAIKSHIGEMVTQTRSGRMPMMGAKLTADEIAMLASWQADGTPNN